MHIAGLTEPVFGKHELSCDVQPAVSVRRLDTAKVGETLHKVYGVAINHDV